MNIVRLISFTILMGTFLLANSNSENLPTPIPIDFGENTGMRIDSTICESCNTSYEADVMGASCCDEATQFNSDFTCEILETTYLWNCSGCACTEDNESWTTDFGCMDELACNYNSDAIWGDDSCSFIDDICQSCDNGEVVDNDNDGDNICNEDEIVGCQDEIACDFNPDATDPGECSYQSTYCEDADEDGFGAGDSINFCLEDVPLGWVDNCTDSEPACATNDTDECGICGGMGAVYGNYENCCEVYVDECGFCSGTNASMDECGVCFGDNSSCMDCSGVPNGDAEPDECGVCNGPGPIYECGCSDAPTENYDCDGNCLIEIDCNDECGGSATEDECGVCDSNSANDCIQDCNGEWGGPAELDECGVCSGDGSTCSSTVSLEIQNVDVENGLLDIYMANTEEVSGFQMEMTGISITDATAPAGFMVSTSSTTILAFSLTGATIPVGEGVLTQVSFTDYMGDEICFGEDTGSAGGTAISGVGGVYIPADWGPCFGGDETIPGCMDEDACNYNPDANEPDDCTYAEENYDCDGNCIAEIDCNNECGGTAVEDECDICDGPGAIYECGCEDIPLGDCDCNGNVEDECGECGGDGSSCSPWTELVAEGGENQISLSWEPFEFLRPSFMGRGCEDDPNICIWNSWYSDFDNQQDCEANGGIWGSYLEYFGSSCNEMVSDAGCNASILYWMVSDLCPESCGVCLDGCTDMDACNFNPDATDDDGSCELPEENYDCDGNCIVGIDCNDECGGSAMEDECGVCNGSGAIFMCEDDSYVCDESECDTSGGSTVSLEIQNVDLDAGILDIYMVNSEEVGGFQMEIMGITIIDASAPDGFMVSTSSTTILAFSLTGVTIPIGEGVLTQVSFSDYLGNEICFGADTGSSGGTAISNADGVYIAADWGACYDGEIVYGCMDMDACNYNPDANTPDDCTYAEENYDCDGNCIVEIDCYGVCGGDFTPDFECFDGSIVCNPSDCGGGEPITYNVYRDGELLMGWLMDPNYVDSDLGYSEPHCYTVTYNYGAGFESEHSNQACSETDEMVVIPGCMDEDACNYNPDANEDDDTCIHPEENYDCDGNCIPGEDECGICGGDGVEIECWDGEIVCEESDCSDEPDNSPFSFNQSSSQAFYHIFSAYDLDGNSLVAGEDWIGVFSGDVCVGAREWTNDISTDIPAMGDDGYWYSIGYLQEGDYPSFQIFDASENLYYPAHPAEEFAFSNNGTFSVESLSAGINYTLSLNNHHNLVSFYALPEDVSITGVTSDLGNNALSVIAEGSSAINLDGLWSGSLTEFSGENGYWISINNFPDNLSVIGFDMDPDRMYELHEGPNLISFPDSGSADLSSAIPDDVEHLFTAIISEGISALNSDNGWAGSLTGFQGGAGYWVIVQEDLTFSYNTEDLLSRSVHSFLEKLPDEAGFTVAQSSRQAFYFVNSIKLDNGSVEDGDWILSYNNDVLAGIRQWKGKSVDIPAMGSANDIVTAGYFNLGDTPAFKLLKQSTGEIIALEGNIPSWSNNGIFSVGELYEKQPIPELFTLNKAYPNPFNPTTTIGFGLPDQSEIMVEIFNLHGKRVEILVDKSMPSGYSSVVWNADKFSSGLYFVKLSAQSFNGIKYTSIQKLMLVK